MHQLILDKAHRQALCSIIVLDLWFLCFSAPLTSTHIKRAGLHIVWIKSSTTTLKTTNQPKNQCRKQALFLKTAKTHKNWWNNTKTHKRISYRRDSKYGAKKNDRKTSFFSFSIFLPVQAPQVPHKDSHCCQSRRCQCWLHREETRETSWAPVGEPGFS